MIFGEEESNPMANQPQQGNNQQQQVRIDASRMDTIYSNFFATSATGEEITVYLGANSLAPNSTQPMPILSHRLMLTPPNAKRMMQALQQTVTAYEKNFGPIEVTPPPRQD
ncbi:MAG: DUF3467 domain-containing protein [Phycisphaerae bacterium]|nr:DUF3467 domain-containing protein [Phycisphaerae bacterium]